MNRACSSSGPDIRKLRGAFPAAEEALLSIEDLARQTGLEESLLRYYESEYGHRLPAKVLSGSGAFFVPAAAPAFLDLHRELTGAPAAAASGGERFARVLAVTSGKGGVGKSHLALNLAIELQRQGRMCVLLDADLGMGNAHILAGINPAATLAAVVEGAAPITEVISEGPEGIGIIAGGSGVLALADATRHQRMTLLCALQDVEGMADFILVDTGAGMGQAVRDFLDAADELLFVLTPDVTALADAYGLLKSVRGKAEPLAKPVYTVVNMAENLAQAAETARRFALCAGRHLGIEVGHLGYILRDATVSAATAHRKPYTVFRPQARVSRNTANVATLLLRREDPSVRISSAFGRYLNMLMRGKIL